MRRAFFLWLLLSCGSPQISPPLAEPALLRNPQVATLDGEPIFLKDVVEFSIDTDFDGLLRRYLLKRLGERRRKALGIENTEEEHLARARLGVDLLRQARGQAAVDQRVAGSGLKTEDEYVRGFAHRPALDTRLSIEKMMAYDFLTRDSIVLELVGFESKEQAKQLLGATPGPDLAKVTAALRLDAIHTPPLRVLRGMLQAEFSEAVERELFNTEVGTLAGPYFGKREFWWVARIGSKQSAIPGEYSALKRQVFESVLKDPPSDDAVERYFDLMLRSSAVKRISGPVPR